MENGYRDIGTMCQHIIELHAFDTYTQPIFSLVDLSTYGYEVLNRPIGMSTESFYDEIVQCGCFVEVDRFLVEKSLCVARALPGLTFINIYPSTLLKLPEHCLKNDNIIFELNEREVIRDWSNVLSVIGEKTLNIAIDDLCKGAAGLRALIEVRPSFVKLDKWLISGIESSQRKQELIKFLVDYLSGTSKLIAEGIEHSAELDVIRSLGVHFAQGYLLGKPQILNQS